MIQITDHPGVAELRVRWRESKGATLARHEQEIRLLADGRGCAGVAGLTGFVRRWGAALVARCNCCGRSSPGDRRRGDGVAPTIPEPGSGDVARAG